MEEINSENNNLINESDNEVTTLKGHRDYDDWVFIHRNLNRPPYYSIKAGKSGGPVGRFGAGITGLELLTVRAPRTRPARAGQRSDEMRLDRVGACCGSCWS